MDDACKTCQVTRRLEVVFNTLLSAIWDNSLERVRAILNSVRHHSLSLLTNSSQSSANTNDSGNSGSGGRRVGDQSGVGGGESPEKSLVNLLCPTTKKSALYIALERGHLEIGRELLNSGANPCWQYQGREPFLTPITEPLLGGTNIDDSRTVSCLDLAVLSGNVETAEMLMRAGAKVTLLSWSIWFHKLSEHRQMFRSLLAGSGVSVPISIVCCALVPYVGEAMEDLKYLLLQGIGMSWIHGEMGEDLHLLSALMQGRPHVRFLLQMPARDRVQQFYKSLLLQTLFMHVCCGPSRLDRDLGSLLSLLVEEGASPHGWTFARTMVMQRAWLYLKMPRQFLKENMKDQDLSELQDVVTHWRRKFWMLFEEESVSTMIACETCAAPFPDQFDWRRKVNTIGARSVLCTLESSPLRLLLFSQHVNFIHPACFVPAILCFRRNKSNTVKRAVLAHTKVAWLNNVRRIPMSLTSHLFERIVIHDGPTCSHANLLPEQKETSLMMCTCSGTSFQSLMSLCRDVIMPACLENTDNVFFAIENLPLPKMMKWYMLRD